MLIRSLWIRIVSAGIRRVIVRIGYVLVRIYEQMQELRRVLRADVLPGFVRVVRGLRRHFWPNFWHTAL